MLKSLYIKNYAIIDEITIEFNSGFNVFTGETGAGKSIIVGALSFLIKGKADPSIIRTGHDKAIIEGVFSLEDFMKPMLDEADIEYEDELIVRRTISKDNHNTIKINQCSVTLNFLSQLFGEHIDIHSQKDSQYLLNRKNHLILLDKYAGSDTLLKQYRNAYKEYASAAKEYEELINNTYNETDLDYYRFDLNELDSANIDPEEEKQLNSKEKIYKSAEKYLSVLKSSDELYNGEDGIKEKLSTLFRNLTIDDERINEIKTNIENLYYSLNDEVDKLSAILDSFNDEDLNIEYIEERLYLYSKLKRKYATDTEGLIAKRDELKEKIAFFEDKDIVLAEKKRNCDKLKAEALEIAKTLHKLREAKAISLQNDIIRHCNDLMLNNVNFTVRIENKDNLDNNGIDDIEFYISLNKGEEPKPLRNIASGGEISRLMLALKTVFTSLSETMLIVFDEIDTGVSGKVALAIGQKMSSIAQKTQVLTITHLAAVAACASDHYYIFKNDDEGYSKTMIRKLNLSEIINELAVISSSELSESSIKAAEELYSTAQESIHK